LRFDACGRRFLQDKIAREIGGLTELLRCDKWLETAILQLGSATYVLDAPAGDRVGLQAVASFERIAGRFFQV
jgi:hypothetical protein